jgi:hypothetical protein
MIIILGILALLYLLYSTTLEHMTTQSIKDKEDFHKKAKKWHKEPEENTEQQIKGPKIPEKDVEDAEKSKNTPDPSESDGSKKSVYPDIYGPETLLAPGHKDKHKDGDMDKISPDFIPAPEFPPGPKEPSPFLGSFSKFLRP